MKDRNIFGIICAILALWFLIDHQINAVVVCAFIGGFSALTVLIEAFVLYTDEQDRLTHE